MGGRPSVRARAGLGACVTAFALVLAGAPVLAGDAKAAKAKHKEAAALVTDGDYARALAVIDEGLALDPGNLALLQLRAATLFELRDYEAALAAYEAFLAAGPKGANKRAAQRIVANLEAARTTTLDLTITGATEDDPATVYLDTKSLGVFCVAAPRCTRGMLPDDYKLIVERPGFKKMTEKVTVKAGQTLALERGLLEDPSALRVTAAATGGGGVPDAIAVLDGKEVGAPPLQLEVAAGDHTLELRAAGHVTERVTFTARRGQPVELAVALRRLVAIAVNVEGAEVLVGDAPATYQDGALVLPDGAVTLTVRADGYRVQTLEVPAARPEGYRLDVALAPAPAPLSVEGAPPGAVISVDGRRVGVAPLTAPVEVEQGAHTVTVTAAGRATLQTRVEVGSPAPLVFEVERMPSTRRVWTWVAAAGTGAALVSWGAFGAMALGRESDYAARAGEPGVTPSDEMLTSLAADGDRFATIADVSMVAAVVGAGAATWLFLREGKGAAEGRITPIVAAGRDGGAVGLQGSF